MSALPALTLEQAAALRWDLAVVGAGPAGSMVAREAARRGVSVLLIDKARFPRRKVCGCCINVRALSALEASGLGSLPEELGAVPLRRIRVACRGRIADLALPGGVSLSRDVLDLALARGACDAGAALLEGAMATGSAVNGAGRTLRVRSRDSEAVVRARVVVGADGLGGRLFRGDGLGAYADRGSRIGAGARMDAAPDTYEPGTVYMACGSAGYVGLVRLEDGRLDLAAALDTAAVKGAGLGEAAAAVVAGTGLPPVPGLADLDWRGTPGLTRTAATVAGTRAFLVGDATGYVEPFTGEGMAWALTSALALAPIAADAARDYRPDLEQAWDRAHLRLVRRRQGLCRLVAAGLRRPAVTATAVAALAPLPRLAQPFIRRINAPLEPTGTAYP